MADEQQETASLQTEGQAKRESEVQETPVTAKPESEAQEAHEAGDAQHAPATPKFRTRFPVSRIKKIMQADEAVGKIAQTTPAVVSRAVEVFLEGMLLRAIAEEDCVRVTPGVLKRLVARADEYDFLRAMFEAVPEDKTASRSSAEPSPAKRAAKSAGDKRNVRRKSAPIDEEQDAPLDD